MLKREENREIIKGVRIKTLSLEETNKLMKQLNKVAKKDNGEIDYDNPKAIYLLFKKLIETDIKEIKNINEESFTEAYYNPTEDMQTICFEIGRVVSSSIINSLRGNITALMETEMQMLQAEAITKLNNITESAKEIKKSNKKKKK